MRDISNKTDGVSSLSGAEYTSHMNEAENAVTASGQTLSSGDNYQHAKAHAINAARGDFYTDGGSVNVIELTSIGAMHYPVSNIVGNRVRFNPSVDNDATSVTIKLGSLDAKFANLGKLSDGGTPNVPIGFIESGKIYSAVLTQTDDTLTTYWQIETNSLSALDDGISKALIDSQLSFSTADGTETSYIDENGLYANMADVGSSSVRPDGIRHYVRGLGSGGVDTSTIDRDALIKIDASAWTWSAEGDYYVSTPAYLLGKVNTEAVTDGNHGAYSVSFIAYSSGVSVQICFQCLQSWVTYDVDGNATLEKTYLSVDPSILTGLTCYIRMNRKEQ